MRICIVEMPIPVQNPQASSPIGVNVGAYADSFKKLGHDVVVVCGMSPGLKPTMKNYDIVAISTRAHATALGEFMEEFLYSLRVVKCLLSLQKNGLDLIINMNYSTAFIASLMRFNKRLLNKIIAIQAGIEPKKSVAARTIAVLIKRYSFPHIRLVVAQSQTVRARAARLYRMDSRKIVVLSAAGVDTNMFQPRNSTVARQKLGLTGNTTLVLCVSNIEARKNQLSLLRSFRDTLSNHPSCVLVLIGLSLEKDYLRRINEFIAKSGISSNVKFVGYVSGVSQLVSYYNASDLFVLVSLSEGGVPRVALEAMSCGLPCILSRIPEIAEGVSAETLLVNPLNDDEISHALDALIANKQERTRLGSKARVTAMRYDWYRLSKDLLEIAKSPRLTS